ncbi:MAG: tail fiber domain-containing protein, partial [Lachnospiraceae bacterium]|nr:tail fiber domain-containing protein [Lachnospiraceae bacterium]
TYIDANHMISPYIGGGYLNITGNNCYVTIDPAQKIPFSNVICVNADGEDKFYVTHDGDVYLKGKVYATDGEFSGKVTANEGQIGNFTIKGSQLQSYDNDAGLLMIAKTGRSCGSGFFDFPAVWMNKGKLIFSNLFKATLSQISYPVNELTQDHGYVDISSSGIYAKYGKYSDQPDPNYYTFAVDTTNNKVSIGCSRNTSVTLGNKDTDVICYGGLVFPNTAQDNNYYGIRRSDATNIIRGTQAHGVYVGGTSSVDLWLGANDVYYTGNAPIAHSSDRRIKSEINNIKNATEFIMGLKPCEYKLSDSKSNRRHWGFIADEVENTMLETTGDSGVFVKQPINDKTKVDLDDESTYLCGLRYDEFIAPMVATIQQQEEKIQSQQETINDLTSTIDSLTLRLQSLENTITQLTNKDGD